MPIVLDGTNGITTPDLESSGPVIGTTGTLTALTVNGNNISAVNSMGFRNRIINGDMRIDQRNNGAAVTVNTGGAFYAVDRFRISSVASAGVFTGQRVADAPAEFNSSMKVTVTTADASLAASDAYYCLQDVEGYNVADFKLGTANAATFTLSFWVKSSLTGTFGASFSNNDVTRSYPFSYTISAANTWEKKTVTVVGDTTGTWDTGTGRGLRVIFSLGVGSDFIGTADQWNGAFDIAPTGAVNLMATNAATWQITGVQLEAGTVATPFERRDYGRELMMCQRYFFSIQPTHSGYYNAGADVLGTVPYPVPMRSGATLSVVGTLGNITVNRPGNSGTSVSSIGFANDAGAISTQIRYFLAASASTGQGTTITYALNAYLTASAEL